MLAQFYTALSNYRAFDDVSDSEKHCCPTNRNKPKRLVPKHADGGYAHGAIAFHHGYTLRGSTDESS